MCRKQAKISGFCSFLISSKMVNIFVNCWCTDYWYVLSIYRTPLTPWEKWAPSVGASSHLVQQCFHQLGSLGMMELDTCVLALAGPSCVYFESQQAGLDSMWSLRSWVYVGFNASGAFFIYRLKCLVRLWLCSQLSTSSALQPLQYHFPPFRCPLQSRSHCLLHIILTSLSTVPEEKNEKKRFSRSPPTSGAAWGSSSRGEMRLSWGMMQSLMG